MTSHTNMAKTEINYRLMIIKSLISIFFFLFLSSRRVINLEFRGKSKQIVADSLIRRFFDSARTHNEIARLRSHSEGLLWVSQKTKSVLDVRTQISLHFAFIREFFFKDREIAMTLRFHDIAACKREHLWLNYLLIYLFWSQTSPRLERIRWKCCRERLRGRISRSRWWRGLNFNPRRTDNKMTFAAFGRVCKTEGALGSNSSEIILSLR